MTLSYGYNEAKAHLEHIQELLAALGMDWDRYFDAKLELEDIQSEIESEIPTADEELQELTEALEELKTEITEFDSLRLDCEDSDEVMVRIMQYPLSVKVRSGWRFVSDFEEVEPEEFSILLCTGGPAVQIVGELDGDGYPSRAWIEYCDQSTPWTVFDESNKAILEFAQQFTYRH